MKLLIDENLSKKLPARLEAIFPGSKHVGFINELGISASDDPIWNYAYKNDFTIITKDYDFVEKINQYGPPPNIIKVNSGNASVRSSLLLIQSNEHKIKTYFSKPNNGLLIL